jgi:glycosyltransferase involved in cell wall biosynthesis
MTTSAQEHEHEYEHEQDCRMKWICCQLGAREHYAIPRALSRLGTLDWLITDAWVPPSSILAKISAGNLADRFHNELSNARVMAFNSSLIRFEALARARQLAEWKTIIARNQWFQRKVVNALTSLPAGAATKTADFRPLTSDAPALLSYSYAALEPFRYAKANGWKTLLVQIDPGPEEERIVADEAARVAQLAGDWHPAPPEYWAFWREECKLADRIIVNSEWSREGLIRGGVPGEKLSIIPLAYKAPEIRSQKSAAFAEAPAAREVGGQKSDVGDQQSEARSPRAYPPRFTRERPLRVLFLGLINLRKGVARLLEAAQILRDEPVEFWMVGPVEIANASTVAEAGRVKWFGPVTRKKAAEFYRDADVFILPTLSDGFAITQLEAQAHGLPIIASRCCGNVVENGVNGIILEEPTAACIAHAIHLWIANPDRLQKLAEPSELGNKFTLSSLAQNLGQLDAAL